MIKGSDGYEYETLHDCFVGRKAETRYNILLHYIEQGESSTEQCQAFKRYYARYLEVGYDPARATDNAYWAVFHPDLLACRPQGPGSPDRVGQPGAGPAPTDLVHSADQPSV